MSRRAKLEQLLESDPDDVFLQYALALEFVSEGNRPLAAERLEQLLARDPSYIAAYFQLGRILAEDGDTNRARDTLRRGIATANRAGDTHAAAEMQGLLETLPTDA